MKLRPRYTPGRIKPQCQHRCLVPRPPSSPPSPFSNETYLPFRIPTSSLPMKTQPRYKHDRNTPQSRRWCSLALLLECRGLTRAACRPLPLALKKGGREEKNMPDQKENTSETVTIWRTGTYFGDESLKETRPRGGREGRREGGGGGTQLVHGRSPMTIDPRIPTMPGRSTSGFHQPGRRCLHQARSAVRCSASRMKGELNPPKNRS